MKVSPDSSDLCVCAQAIPWTPLSKQRCNLQQEEITRRFEDLLEQHWPAGTTALDLELTVTHMVKLNPSAGDRVRLICTALTSLHLQLHGQPAEAPPEYSVLKADHPADTGDKIPCEGHLPSPAGTGPIAEDAAAESGYGAAQQGRPATLKHNGLPAIPFHAHQSSSAAESPSRVQSFGGNLRGVPRHQTSQEARVTPTPGAGWDSQSTLPYGARLPSCSSQHDTSKANQDRGHGAAGELATEPEVSPTAGLSFRGSSQGSRRRPQPLATHKLVCILR